MGRTKYIGCKIEKCLEPHRSRGFCRKHYRIAIGEGKKRYLRVKESPYLLKTARDAQVRYRTTETYREHKKTHDKTYYEKHKEAIKVYKSEWNETKRFGVERDTILKRDGYKCTNCKHPIIAELVIHHIDGQGRSTNTPNNNPDNLVTLCRSCHMKIHPPLKI